MRIFYATIIAFLFGLLAAGLSSANMTDRSCCTDGLAGGTMNMLTCHCTHVMPDEVHADSGRTIPAETDCCAPATCRGSLIPPKVAFCSPASPVVSFVMVQTVAFFQPMPPALLGAHRTGLPPPRLLFPPVYIKNCSFLI
jgi:hypothetical protein